MKLKLRIGRQRAQTPSTDEALTGSEPAARARELPPVTRPAAPTRVPAQQTTDRRVVRAGSFCRASEIGQVAVTEGERAVRAVDAGHCGRWVYDDRT